MKVQTLAGNLLKKDTLIPLIAFLFILSPFYSIAQGNSGGTPGGGTGGGPPGGGTPGGGGTAGQCIPSNPAYDPCLCGDQACNVPIDSWVIYLVGGVAVFGYFRLRNQSLNTSKVV